MKEYDKIKVITLLKSHLYFKDGFRIFEGNIITPAEARQKIREQFTMLEKDVTDIMSELTFNTADFDVETFFKERIKSKAKPGKSAYFESLDKLYPNNKFRQIMNYYLFSPEHYCFMLVGYGQTGKTTFVDIAKNIIGSDFFERANVALVRNIHGSWILEGKKLLELTEAQDLDLDTANLLKNFITQNAISINPKFEQPRTIQPHAKMVITCNNVPRFKVTDDGIIRRFITVKMNKKIKQDPDFLDKIKEDIPFIIYEATQNPFRIENFAEEQYSFFEDDPQYGFGCGKLDKEIEQVVGGFGENTEYARYVLRCRAHGYFPRSKRNYDEFINLEKIYRGRLKKCVTTLKESAEQSGTS